MGSSSHDLGGELRMHYFTVNCDTFSNEDSYPPKARIIFAQELTSFQYSTDTEHIIYLHRSKKVVA